MMKPKEIDFNSRLKTTILKLLLIASIILAGELKSCAARTITQGVKREARVVKRSTPFHRHKRKQQLAFAKTCVHRQKIKKRPIAGYNRFR